MSVSEPGFSVLLHPSVQHLLGARLSLGHERRAGLGKWAKADQNRCQAEGTAHAEAGRDAKA